MLVDIEDQGSNEIRHVRNGVHLYDGRKCGYSAIADVQLGNGLGQELRQTRTDKAVRDAIQQI